MLRARARRVDVFSPPAVSVVPSSPERQRVRGLLRRRRPIEIVLAPPAPPNPAIVFPRLQRRIAQGRARRGRRFDPYFYAYGLPVTDTFAGPVGGSHIADVTGQRWINQAGEFTKDGAGHVRSLPALGIATVDTGASDLWIDTRLSTLAAPGTPSAGLVFRFIDASNYWRVLVDANTGYQIAIQVLVAGVASTPFFGGSFSAGDRLAVNLAGPNITLEVNGVVVASLSDATYQSATLHGIISSDSTLAGQWLFDDFHAYLAGLVLPGRSSRRPINSRTFALARRGRHTDFISTPVAPVNPAIVFPAVQHRIVRGLLRRRRPVEIVPPQFNPPIVLAWPQRRVARAWPRRGKTPTVVPAAAAPPNPAIVLSRTQRRVQRGWLRARGRGAQPVPAQVVQINPALPGNTTLRRRLLALFSRRRTSGGRVPSSAIVFGPTPNNVTGPDGRSFVTGATGRSSVSGPDGRSDVTGPSGSTIIQ